MVLNIAGDYMKSFTTKVEEKDDDKEKEKAEEAKVCSNFTIIRLCKCDSLKHKTGVYRGILYCLIFAQKHRLWVLVRTASFRRF